MAAPLLFAAQAPDLIGYDATGASDFTSNFTRYRAMPGARENRFVYTLESASVGAGHWVDTGNGTIEWLADVPIDANGAGGGPGASYTITSAAAARFHTDNANVEYFLRFRSQEVHCISFEVFHLCASSRNVKVRVDEIGGPSPIGYESSSQAVPPNQWTRVYYGFTPQRKPTLLAGILCDTSLGWSATEKIYWRRPMLEPGVATPGEWFSGSSEKSDTVPGPKWFDARSGYPRNPCEGISVSNAGWLLVGETTQLVVNPYGTVNTTGRTGTNGTLATTTDYAIQGTGSIRLTATGANAKDTASISPTISGQVAVEAIVKNDTASARTCRLIVDGVAIAGTSQSLPAYGEAWLRGPATVVAGNTYVIGVEWTNSANTETFITQYLGGTMTVMGTPMYGLYPAPPLQNNGTIELTASWTGTAHNSKSTLAGSSLIAGYLSARARSQRGAAVVRLMRNSLIDDERVVLTLGYRNEDPEFYEQLQLWAGPTNPETFVRYYPGADIAYGLYDSAIYGSSYYGPVYGTKVDIAGQAITGPVLVDLMMEWDGDLLAIEQLGSWRVEGNRIGHSPHGQLAGTLEIGCCQNASAEVFDGLIAGVLTANRPLTLAEKDRIHASPVWTYGMIDDLQPGYVQTPTELSTGLGLATPLIAYTGIGFAGGSGGSWDYDLRLYRADLANVFLEDITDQLTDGSLDGDDARDVKAGGTITLKSRTAIDPQVDLIAPYLTMTREDGTVRKGQLGLFLTSMPSGLQDLDRAEGVFQLRDVTELLSRSILRTTYNVSATTPYLTALATLASGVGIGRLVLPTTSATFAANSSERKGSNRLALFNGWCRALGWQEVMADQFGRLVTEVHRRIRQTEPLLELTEDMLFAVPEDQPMTENFYNTIVVRGDNPSGTPIVGIAVNDDPADPISTVNIGEYPMPDVMEPNLTTQSAADDLADRLLEKAGSWERVVKAKILAIPNVSVNRSVHIKFRNQDNSLDGLYWLRKWKFDLMGDGTMDIELNRIVRRSS